MFSIMGARWTAAISGEGHPLPDLQFKEEQGLPTYEYYCEKCERVLTMIMREFNPPLSVKCDKCKKLANRVYSTAAIHYKGEGFTKGGSTLVNQ